MGHVTKKPKKRCVWGELWKALGQSVQSDVGREWMEYGAWLHRTLDHKDEGCPHFEAKEEL